MKYLIMCEGNNEEALINLLLDSNSLKLSRDDLLGRRPYPIRQLSHPTIKTEIKHYGMPITVLRVGDKQNDTLKIPLDLKKYIDKNNIYKFCTKPELEILLIINESLIKDYEKVKQNVSPKEYAKSNIKYNGIKYDQSTEFLINYYKNNINSLINNIKEYKHIKKHNKDELYLIELLKKR